MKCSFGFGELAGAEISEAEIVETLLGFGIEFHGAFEQRDGFARISGIERGGAGFDQIIRFCGGGNSGKAGGIIFDDEGLIFVRFDGAGEGVVIAGAGGGELAHLEIQDAFGGENVILETVDGFEFGVVAGDGYADRSLRAKIRGQR